jgi:predicted nucleic acid-binding protein
VAVALDSNIVIGFLDRSDELHGAADEAIRDLLRSEPIVTSAITYAEVMTGARLGHHDEERVKGFFADLVSRVLSVDVAVADRAATLRATAKALNMPDALVAAAAELDPDVQLLVSGDRDMTRLRGLGCPVHLLTVEG